MGHHRRSGDRGGDLPLGSTEKGETSGSERVNEGDGLQRRLYVSYCPRRNSKLTQYPLGVRKPQQNRYEISGLEQASQRRQALRCWS